MYRSEEGDPEVTRNLACSKYEFNIEEVVEQEEKLCNEVEIIRVYNHGDIVCVGGNTFPVKLILTVCMNCVMPPIMYRSKA